MSSPAADATSATTVSAIKDTETATNSNSANNSTSPSPVPTSSTSAPQQTSGTPSAPSPLLVGKSFVKQYYQVLSTSPQDIHRFYKPNSLISHSFLPDVPADAKTLEHVSSEELFEWASPTSSPDATSTTERKSSGGLCLDFGRGAIDAQETVNGGILLVVTGHIKLPKDDGFKAFVQTFYLNNGAKPGKKRQFYIHNDVLRLLATSTEDVETLDHPQLQDEDATNTTVYSDSTNAVISSTTKQDSSTVSTQVVDDSSTNVATSDNVEESKATEPAPTADTANADLPSTSVSHGDVQQENLESEAVSKTANTATTTTTTTTSKKSDNKSKKEDEDKPKDEKKGKKRTKSRSKKEKNGSRSASPTDKVSAGADGGKGSKSGSTSTTDASSSSKPKTPGSWASLVAGGSSTTPSSSKPSQAAITAANTASKVLLENGAVITDEDVPSKDNSSTETAKTDNKTTSSQHHTSTQQQSSSRPTSTFTHQRNPEATLLIKNISDKTKESDIRSMFEPYATKHNQKILGITLKSLSGFCFVDFDSKNVVDVILKDVEVCKEKNKTSGGGRGAALDGPFVLHGRFLDIGRKIPIVDNKGGSSSNRGGGGGSQEKKSRNRSTSPKSQQRSGSGFHHRRNSPRGGNRSGGSKSNSGNGK